MVLYIKLARSLIFKLSAEAEVHHLTLDEFLHCVLDLRVDRGVVLEAFLRGEVRVGLDHGGQNVGSDIDLADAVADGVLNLLDRSAGAAVQDQRNLDDFVDLLQTLDVHKRRAGCRC